MHPWQELRTTTLQIQHHLWDIEPADAGLSGMVTPSAAGNTPQGSLDQPAPFRCGTQKTRTDFHGGTRILFAGSYQSV